MARSILHFVCLSFLLFYKFIDVDSSENINDALESNINITIQHSTTTPGPIVRNITALPDTDTISQTLEISRTLEYRGRIVNTPPKPGPGPNPAAAATAIKKIKYRLGNRIAGDRLVASSALIQQWGVAQNVTQNLSYPKAGVGATISCIEISVEQSNLGRAFVTSGGIGQKNVAITLEAPKTLVFRQNVQIFGY